MSIFRKVRLRSFKGGDGSIFGALSLPDLKRKASNTVTAFQDTFLSTKEVFENHRVVFTVGTSLASILTAWAGYSLRQHQQSKIDKRLKSIEESIKTNFQGEHEEIKRIVSFGTVSITNCVATGLTSLAIGYALGWRGGSWFASRKFRREQSKLMGQIKPRGWQLLRGSLVRLKNRRTAHRSTEHRPEIHAS